MQRSRPLLRILTVVVLVAVIAFVVVRVLATTRYGLPTAVCPGPDFYGYVCDAAETEYIDATTDTLANRDDGIITLTLPFPFSFYGSTYDTVFASTNGNLQFETTNPTFANRCFDEARRMGDLIAPYWDDLNFARGGTLDYDTVGTAPDRIFVVEWDEVPRFDSPSDLVTFEVQLFEGSNDIVFLYERVGTRSRGNGTSATIGLMSEKRELSLTYSCNQATVLDGFGIEFTHPSEPNPELHAPTPLNPIAQSEQPIFVKGNVLVLVDELNETGLEALPKLQQFWLQQSPSLQTSWEWGDVTGDGRDELVFLWHGRITHPEHTELVVLTQNENGVFEGLASLPLLTPHDETNAQFLYSLADKTGDGVSDIILSDGASGRFVYAWSQGSLQRMR